MQAASVGRAKTEVPAALGVFLGSQLQESELREFLSEGCVTGEPYSFLVFKQGSC